MKDRENGRLDPYERTAPSAGYLRTQRADPGQLPPHRRRNGGIYGALQEHESSDRPSQPTGARVRTEELVIDRHGTASRFLRLAFRINMEQLKLVDAPTTAARAAIRRKLAEELRQAAADAAEIAAARQRPPRKWLCVSLTEQARANAGRARPHRRPTIAQY